MQESALRASDVRRFHGSVADELTIRCAIDEVATRPADRIGAAYRQLDEILRTCGARDSHLTSEVVCSGAAGGYLALADNPRSRLAPTLLDHPPLDPVHQLELTCTALVPHDPSNWSVEVVTADPDCGCAACRLTSARGVRVGEHVGLYSNAICGTGSDAEAEALDMFAVADRLVLKAGLDFRDVVRTWIYVRDIDRDYDALNRARRRFFDAKGMDIRPASTGVGGGLHASHHNFAMRVQAVRSSQPVRWSIVSTPMLNEAWTYGADFSRGVRVADANKVALYVSGTASIDDEGRTVHVGDFQAQARRMLANIESLLAGQGAGFSNLVSSVTYLKRPGDADVMRSLFAEAGFHGFPRSMVQAPLCRPELLCETEALALLPLTSPEA